MMSTWHSIPGIIYPRSVRWSREREITGVGEIVLIAFHIDQVEIRLEFEVSPNGLKDVPAGPECHMRVALGNSG
jgi:hypothetical protein